jgi:competence protein ComEC
MSDEHIIRLAFLDVGQGDTTIISIPDTQEAVVVDCIDANSVITYLEREKIKHLRGILITHLHLDHFSGVVDLFNNLEENMNLICERLLFHSPKITRKYLDKIRKDDDSHSEEMPFSERLRKDTLIELLKWAQQNRQRYNTLAKQPGMTLPMPDVIELLHPWEVDVTDLLASSLNDLSAVLKVKGVATSALLMGDLELVGWEVLKKQNLDLRSDVLKFPHHGAWKNDTPQELLDIVDPSVVVISGSGNQVHDERHSRL